jgi:hypothetical protein
MQTKLKLKLVLKSDVLIAGYLDPQEETLADRLVSDVTVSKSKVPCG